MRILGTLPTLDLCLILGFFLLTLAAGLYFGRRLPWWVLGMSGTASNFDMTGTMVMVSLLFAIGLQGFWVAMRGGMCLPLGLLLVYMGAWLRRSRVMTTAEWMELRFGTGPAGQAARILSALANLVVTVAFLTYFVKGTGKFLAVFLPLDADACSLLMVTVGLLYTAASGLFGVVYTDVLQEVLMLAAAVWVGIQAATLPDHATALAAAGPQWLSLAPQATTEPMGWLTDPTMYQAFGLCIVFWMARGLLEGAGGLTGGYMPQRYYAAKNDREAVYLTAQWIILLLFRWALIAGVVVLGLAAAAGDPQVASVLSADPEKTLPLVIFRALPSGVRGVYQRYLHPEAGQKQLVRQGRPVGTPGAPDPVLGGRGRRVAALRGDPGAFPGPAPMEPGRLVGGRLFGIGGGAVLRPAAAGAKGLKAI
jgi:Na+/proline symporter